MGVYHLAFNMNLSNLLFILLGSVITITVLVFYLWFGNKDYEICPENENI
jgi:hypothetical protein